MKRMWDDKEIVEICKEIISKFYKDGELIDGENSVSIADLSNLIEYAKGQGWIS